MSSTTGTANEGPVTEPDVVIEIGANGTPPVMDPTPDVSFPATDTGAFNVGYFYFPGNDVDMYATEVPPTDTGAETVTWDKYGTSGEMEHYPFANPTDGAS